MLANQEKVEAREGLDAMLNSTSWKITAPIRKIKQWLSS
jgi:hypothetical protein